MSAFHVGMWLVGGIGWKNGPTSISEIKSRNEVASGMHGAALVSTRSVEFTLAALTYNLIHYSCMANLNSDAIQAALVGLNYNMKIGRRARKKAWIVAWPDETVNFPTDTSAVIKIRIGYVIRLLLRCIVHTHRCECMLNHCLEWDKWMLTNFDHDRQWFNTLIPPLHESAAVNVDCISRLNGVGPVRLSPRYTTADIHCRDRLYEWDGGISRFKT